MSISTVVITDFNEILKIENSWNRQLVNCSENPFLYSRILCGFMRSAKSSGWTPLVFTFWAENKIVGIIPLRMQKKLGSTYVSSLSTELYSDVFLSNQHHEECITQLVDHLFGQLKCLFVSFTFQNGDSYIKKMQDVCETKGFKVSTVPFSERAILPVSNDWDSFYGSIKRSERKKLRKLKRKFDRLGEWNVSRAELNDASVRRILSVEQLSWKKYWRAKNNLAADYALQTLLDESLPKDGVEPFYKPEVWFLEVGRQTIAYRFIFVYKGTVSFLKTSYNAEFRKLAPGKFLLRIMVEDFFKKRDDIKRLDFVTNLHVVQMWNPVHVPRTTVNIERNHFLCSVENIAYDISFIRVLDRLLRRLFNIKSH